MDKIIIGSRASKLALIQTKNFIKQLMEYYPDCNFIIKKIKTTGDRIVHKSLQEIGGKGLFIKEIEHALKTGEIDVAVHSLKDMPGNLGEDFILACYPQREDPRDVLISRDRLSLNKLPVGARLGTGSFRRRAQLKRYRPDLKFEGIRGNVDTRLEKMETMKLEGIVLAAAGIHRMKQHGLISQYISEEISIPAVGQGTLGIEIIKERNDLLVMLNKIDDISIKLASLAERNFLTVLGGNCHSPLGAYARLNLKKGLLTLTGFLASIDGKEFIKKQGQLRLYCEEKAENQARKLGERVALSILEQGGTRLLEGLKGSEG